VPAHTPESIHRRICEDTNQRVAEIAAAEFRTQREFEDERNAQKALRGEFESLSIDGQQQRDSVDKALARLDR
jgi:hypothetical protein